jgi:hypothetical protein
MNTKQYLEKLLEKIEVPQRTTKGILKAVRKIDRVDTLGTEVALLEALDKVAGEKLAEIEGALEEALRYAEITKDKDAVIYMLLVSEGKKAIKYERGWAAQRIREEHKAAAKATLRNKWKQRGGLRKLSEDAERWADR